MHQQIKVDALQGVRTHSNPHIQELLAWEQIADSFQPESIEELNDDGQPYQDNYVPHPAAGYDPEAPKETNLSRCDSQGLAQIMPAVPASGLLGLVNRFRRDAFLKAF